MPKSFPSGFTWGAAAASYQIEGASSEDGRGASVWDAFSRQPGAVWSNQTGDIACDHYHRYETDVAIMREIGLGAYRLSVSWPRVLPQGTGRVNSAGLAFYDRLIDALLDAGITPWVTLFHWDLPLALQRRGGWLNRDIADWYADYVSVVVAKLSDRVRHFITLNEPQVFVSMGLREGCHAPGLRLPWSDVLLAAHNALLSHGRGVQAIRAAAVHPCRVGMAPAGQVYVPADANAPEQVSAARGRTFSTAEWTLWTNSWWMDPVVFGRYPEDGLALFGAELPQFPSADLETMRQPLDFFGVNIYHGYPVRSRADGSAEAVERPIGHALTGFDWPITPEALYWGPRFFYERYRLPIVITENGVSCRDWVSLDGRVHDPQRIDFLARHLRALHGAIEESVPVEGYFHWSILDNFEWAQGYKERFGLVFVDFATQRRILKDSARWYAQVIATNGAVALADP